MLEFLFSITSKPIVFSVALIGGVLATFPSVMATIVNILVGNFRRHDRKAFLKSYEKASVQTGYFLMFVSIFLFIIAGFIVDLTEY